MRCARPGDIGKSRLMIRKKMAPSEIIRTSYLTSDGRSQFWAEVSVTRRDQHLFEVLSLPKLPIRDENHPLLKNDTRRGSAHTTGDTSGLQAKILTPAPKSRSSKICT